MWAKEMTSNSDNSDQGPEKKTGREGAKKPAPRGTGATGGAPGKKGARVNARTPIKVEKPVVPAATGASNHAALTVSAKDLKSWERVRAKLLAKLGAEAFNSWFGRCRLESVSKSQLLMSVPTTFLKTWIRTHYSKQLLAFWQEQNEEIVKIDVVVRSALRSAPNGDDPEGERQSSPQKNGRDAGQVGSFAALPPMKQPGRTGIRDGDGSYFGAPSTPPNGADRPGSFAGSPLDPNYTFATFVEGPTNRMACAAARSVAEADGAALRFNPLFIHANVGLGKTHLLQAIAWAANERNNGVKMLYLTAEFFMWRFASAIRDKSALSFKESLRDIDLLLIDDMQFLQGKSIQQEFCHLLNALIDSAKQVVVAADRPPAELESIDERVRSRLQGGVSLEVKAPTRDMRREMLDLRLRDVQREDASIDIPDDILDLVADRVSSSGRDLEGAFNQILIQYRFSDGVVEKEAIERVIGHLAQTNEQKRVRIEDIQKVVSRHYNVSRNDLLSNRRTRIIVRPRQIAMYLAKSMTPRSLPEIGRRFGGRDHTTVLHAVRKIEKQLDADRTLAQEIELLKRLILELGL